MYTVKEFRELHIQRLTTLLQKDIKSGHDVFYELRYREVYLDTHHEGMIIHVVISC